MPELSLRSCLLVAKAAFLSYYGYYLSVIVSAYLSNFFARQLLSGISPRGRRVVQSVCPLSQLTN